MKDRIAALGNSVRMVKRYIPMLLIFAVMFAAFGYAFWINAAAR